MYLHEVQGTFEGLCGLRSSTQEEGRLSRLLVFDETIDAFTFVSIPSWSVGTRRRGTPQRGGRGAKTCCPIFCRLDSAAGKGSPGPGFWKISVLF